MLSVGGSSVVVLFFCCCFFVAGIIAAQPSLCPRKAVCSTCVSFDVIGVVDTVDDVENEFNGLITPEMPIYGYWVYDAKNPAPNSACNGSKSYYFGENNGILDWGWNLIINQNFTFRQRGLPDDQNTISAICCDCIDQSYQWLYDSFSVVTVPFAAGLPAPGISSVDWIVVGNMTTMRNESKPTTIPNLNIFTSGTLLITTDLEGTISGHITEVIATDPNACLSHTTGVDNVKSSFAPFVQLPVALLVASALVSSLF